MNFYTSEILEQISDKSGYVSLCFLQFLLVANRGHKTFTRSPVNGWWECSPVRLGYRGWQHAGESPSVRGQRLKQGDVIGLHLQTLWRKADRHETRPPRQTSSCSLKVITETVTLPCSWWKGWKNRAAQRDTNLRQQKVAARHESTSDHSHSQGVLQQTCSSL